MSEPEPQADPTDRSERLFALLAQCIDLVGTGGLPAAEALLSQHPELADAVRQRLDKLRRAGLLELPAASDESIPERLGEFRLVRRLAAGGMGVVFLAIQESLQREVALKLVRPEQLYFPGARERFRREVEAIARMNDTGIVPIYMVGEERGLPYFAMEYIAGASLADVLAALHVHGPSTLQGVDLWQVARARSRGSAQEPMHPLFRGTWVQAICRIVQEVACAVHHAHERGVLHRDLKPSNIMITASGRVLVLDFGLAATVGASRLTRSGAPPGTLYYMAPEQVLEQPLDGRTDVYALGVTLYEMLACTVPYRGDSTEEVRRAILAGAPVGLKMHNRNVPTDVDTICRTAMELDPSRRYPTALALAEDLERFLSHRPVQARRAGPWLRMRRSMRRHPAAATAASLLLAIAVVLPVGFMVFRDRFQEEVSAVQRDVARMTAAAEANLQQALMAIARLLEQVADPTMVATPGLDQIRARQLEEAVAQLQRLRSENKDNVKVRHVLARGLMQAADLHRAFGQDDLAERALHDGRMEIEGLLAGQPGDPELILDLAAIEQAAGHLARLSGAYERAAGCWQDCVQRLRLLIADRPTDTRGLLLLSAALGNLGSLYLGLGELDRAFAALLEAVGFDERVRSLPGGLEPRLRHGAALNRMNLGGVLRKRGEKTAALAEFVAVASEFEELLALDPKDPERRRERARAALGIASIHRDLGDVERAAGDVEQAVLIFEGLTRDFPARLTYRWERNMALLEAGTHANDQGQLERAMQAFKAACTDHMALVELEPERLELKAELATMQSRLAEVLVQTGADPEALDQLIAAVANLEQCRAARPGDPYYAIELGGVLTTLGRQHLLENDVQAARDAFGRAVAVLERVLAEGGAPVRSALGLALTSSMDAAAAAGDKAAVVAALERLQELAPRGREQLHGIGRRYRVQDRADFEALLRRAQQR